MKFEEYLIWRSRRCIQLPLSFSDMSRWSKEEVSKAKNSGYIREIDDAECVHCDECHRGCYKEVEFRDGENGTVGVIYCDDEDCSGIIKVSLERLGQWGICADKLKESKYYNEKIPDDYITFNEAARITALDKSNFTRLANNEVVQDNGKKGQHRKLRLSSVLLLKHSREMQDILDDVNSQQEFANSIPDRH